MREADVSPNRRSTVCLLVRGVAWRCWSVDASKDAAVLTLHVVLPIPTTPPRIKYGVEDDQVSLSTRFTNMIACLFHVWFARDEPALVVLNVGVLAWPCCLAKSADHPCEINSAAHGPPVSVVALTLTPLEEICIVADKATVHLPVPDISILWMLERKLLHWHEGRPVGAEGIL